MYGRHIANPGFVSGDHWVECDRCGMDYRQSVMRVEWDGSVVCPLDFEPRQPQDKVRVDPEHNMPTGPLNPEATEIFTDRSGVQANTGEDTVPTGTFSGSGL